jgi:hypothetical protein
MKLNAKDKIRFAVKMIFGIKYCSDVFQTLLFFLKFPVTCVKRIKGPYAMFTNNLNLIPVGVYQSLSVNYGVVTTWAFILIQVATAWLKMKFKFTLKDTINNASTKIIAWDAVDQEFGTNKPYHVKPYSHPVLLDVLKVLFCWSYQVNNVNVLKTHHVPSDATAKHIIWLTILDKDAIAKNAQPVMMSLVLPALKFHFSMKAASVLQKIALQIATFTLFSTGIHVNVRKNLNVIQDVTPISVCTQIMNVDALNLESFVI